MHTFARHASREIFILTILVPPSRHFPVELVRELAECLLRGEQPSVLIAVFQRKPAYFSTKPHPYFPHSMI